MSDAAREGDVVRVPSRLAAQAFHDLLAMPPEWRSEFLLGIPDVDLAQMLAIAKRETGTPYGLWQDDPVGFYELVLMETIWSKQDEVLTSLARPDVQEVVVPAGFGLGKTHIAGGAVCWWVTVWPVGTAGAVTTATRMRQVSKQLWPHVRRLHRKAGLPGKCDMTQWKMPNRDGVDTEVAYGFTAPEGDEAAMQGIHFTRTLLVVDEAGGIDRSIGGSTRNLLTGTALDGSGLSAARLLAIGNPPTDDEGSWFEQETEKGLSTDPKHSHIVTVEIPATASPAVTGEWVTCRACPPEVQRHSLGAHLVDQRWIDEAIDEHGDEAPYVVAKVHARFPRGGAARTIPGGYVDVAMDALEGYGEWWDVDYAALDRPSVDRDGRPYAVQPVRGGVVNLGVDVAADGGDELAIARQEGDIARLRRFMSGAPLENQVNVSGFVLEEIRAAEALRAALGTERPVHVKVDVIGVGWGVVGTLQAWGKEGMHNAVIVPVDVRHNPVRPDDPKAVWRPNRMRDEMWLNGREMLKPDPAGRPKIRLDVDHRTAAQLRGPGYDTNTAGRMVVESKDSLRARGIPSPDRAEAVLLAIYDPGTVRTRKRGVVRAG